MLRPGSLVWIVPLAASLVACGSSPSPTAEPVSPADPAVVGSFAGVELSGPLLPAGIWYRGHTYSTCWDCPIPQAVVVLDIFGDPAAAERALAAIPAGTLPPGYPLVLHTEELGLEETSREGIAVLLGLFETMEQARAWRAKTAAAFPLAEAAALAPEDEAFERWLGMQGRRVVRIQPGEPVPAYSIPDAEALLVAVHCREYGGDADGPCPVPPAVQPLCVLPPGAVFVTTDDEIGGLYYDWLPVRCGDRPAFVAWRWTMFASTVIPQADGTWILRQTVGAECDVPNFEEWAFDANGRSPPAEPPPAPQMGLPPTVAGIRGSGSAGGGQGGCGDS
jgi:hypothetical protein